VINRQSQLSLVQSYTKLLPKDKNGDVMLATGGLYAPTIRYHNGTVYVVCTNVIHQDHSSAIKLQNFIVSTRDIWSNKWSDLVYFDFYGIDPSIFFDGDGKVYMQGSTSPGPMTKIRMFEVDLQTGKKLSEEKEIWGGTGGVYPEGPHLYKRDSWYYLMISEGGTHKDHMITVARSKKVWGPYESFDQNPVLTARGTKEYIQYTGHGDMVQDQEGQWWGVCLGVRVDEGRYVMGRETFLTVGEWSEGEWPKLSRIKKNLVLLNGKHLVRSDSHVTLTAATMVDYLYIRDAKLDDHNISSDYKTITVTASKGDMSQWKNPVTFVGKRQRCLEGISSVLMHTPHVATAAALKAGLAYYKDEHRYIKLFYDFSVSAIILEAVNNAKGISRIASHDVQLVNTVAFRLEYTERSFKFSYGIGKDMMVWKSFDVLDTLDMTGPDFVGPVVGIFATAEVGYVKVRFDELTID
jgi:beta-xylosidase